jgi:hypothetical protein
MMKRLFNIVLCVCALAVASCVNDNTTNEQTAENAPSQDKGVLVINVGTRATDGTQRDYILSIYKNESGKATLVRKYDSSKEEMQKPEYIWLLVAESVFLFLLELPGKADSAPAFPLLPEGLLPGRDRVQDHVYLYIWSETSE